MKTQKITLDLLGPLITSKTRLKLLLRFFLNQNLSGYLQGLSKELEENTNSIRVELNRLEEAGMLNSTLEGRRKLYRVNVLHPLAPDITSIVRKVAGIDTLIDRVVENLPGLKQVWICGDLARGVSSGSIDCILIGEELDADYIAGLSGKVHKLVGKKVNTQVITEIKDDIASACLLVWEINTEE
ncbi:ArsR family transcriptional regulator [Schleiferiaceae bacterium]|nr:ArsR family transcriptional regulator [Schleiferiaceae bacterium]